jgi:hypothetical protein
MSMDDRDGFLSSFSQFLIISDLKLGGIPLSGKDSISWQSCISRAANFGRRVFI